MDYNFDDGRNDFAKDRDYVERRNARRAAERARQRKKKLFARRATIVGIMILIFIIIVVLITEMFGCICATVSPVENNTESTQATQPPTVPQNEASLEFVTPSIEDDGNKDGHYSAQNGAVYIYDGAAYELFAGNESSAADYADCISEFKASVGDTMTVYNMVVPKPIEFYVPQRLKTQSTSQAENIKAIYSSYTEDVVPINCYNELANHADEYIYFRTDHHWTGLGGYYAYKAFCEQTDQKVLDLNVCTENTIEGYEGSLAYCDPILYENLDTVHYWSFPYNAYAMRTESNGDTPYETSIYYEGATSGAYTYGVFIWGDCPLVVEHNDDLKNGKKIAIVKESYGNAMVPYFTANYEEVHVIDFRHFSGNLKAYCEENGITEVLFVNNILAANTAIQVDRIRTLF